MTTREPLGVPPVSWAHQGPCPWQLSPSLDRTGIQISGVCRVHHPTNDCHQQDEVPDTPVARKVRFCLYRTLHQLQTTGDYRKVCRDRATAWTRGSSCTGSQGPHRVTHEFSGMSPTAPQVQMWPSSRCSRPFLFYLHTYSSASPVPVRTVSPFIVNFSPCRIFRGVHLRGLVLHDGRSLAVSPAPAGLG